MFKICDTGQSFSPHLKILWGSLESLVVLYVNIKLINKFDQGKFISGK